MKEKQYIVTEKEMKRYDVTLRVLSGQINLKEAQELLGLSCQKAKGIW